MENVRAHNIIVSVVCGVYMLKWNNSIKTYSVLSVKSNELEREWSKRPFDCNIFYGDEILLFLINIGKL